MKKMSLVLSIIGIVVLLGSCATVMTGQSDQVKISIALDGDDLDFGPIISGTAVVIIDEGVDLAIAIESAKSQARYNAIQGSELYDMILFVRYSIEHESGKKIITATGRSARAKNS